jgi:hypothetical protein
LDRISAQHPQLPPSRARAPPLSDHSRPASARAPARSALRLSLTDEPAPPASCPLSHARFHWQTGPTGQPLCHPPRIRRPTVPSPSSLHRRPFTAVSSPPSPRRTERVRHRPVLPPLDQRPCRYRPAVASHRRRCAAFMAGTVQLAGVRALHRPPCPRAPIKSFPELLLPRTGLDHYPPPLARAQFAKRRRLPPLR